jgi:hypothetical protein
MPTILKIANFPKALAYTCSAALILLGILGFLHFDFIRPNQYLFGVFATAPLINIVLIGAGMALAAKLTGGVVLGSFPLSRHLSQAIAIILALLAMGSFLSLALQLPTWLTLMPNSLISTAIYAILAIYWLYQVWWLKPNQQAQGNQTGQQLPYVTQP